MSTDAENIDIAKQGIEAFNNGDWDAVRAAFTPNATYNEVGTGRLITGADGIVEALQGWKTAFPDVRGTVTNAFASGDQARSRSAGRAHTPDRSRRPAAPSRPPANHRLRPP